MWLQVRRRFSMINKDIYECYCNQNDHSAVFMTVFWKVFRVFSSIQKEKEKYLEVPFTVPVPEGPGDRTLTATSPQKERCLVEQVTNKLKSDTKNLKRKLSTVNEIEAASEEYVSEICELEKLNKRLRLAAIDNKEMKVELTKMKRLYQEKEESLGPVEKKLESLKIKNKRVDLTLQELFEK